jgi:hypothetical protein
MSENKPTPGPWVLDPVNDVFAANGELVAVLNGYSSEEQLVPNAALIAEAGTVYHETDLTPRQLVEQRDALREALEPFAAVAEHDIGEGEADIDLFRPMNHNRAPLLTVGDLRRALAALAKLEPQP